MKIEDYKLLLTLNEVGTIRGTAKVVLISQPAVTQRLKYIEEYFEQKIFIRTSKKLVLTSIGEIILDHAKEVITREEALKNRLSQSSEDVQGTLSIACSSIISQRYLPSILARFTKEFPKVTIDLVTGTSEDIKRDHRQYHVNIIRGRKLKELVSERLFEDPLYIFDTVPFPTEQLKERAIIAYKSDDSMHELAESWLYEQKQHIKPQKTITVDQIETCKEFMKEGLGMAVLPQSVSSDLMDTYPYLPLMIEDEHLTRSTWVCYQDGIRNLRQVEAFLNILQTETFI